MPWQSNEDLPEAVRSALPAGAQTRFRQVGNERLRAGDSDSSAIAQAWHVVGLGWKKPKDGGRWVRKDDNQQPFAKVSVTKFNEDLGLVFGYAIVCKEDGEPYFDLQGDHIPEDAMLKAAADFMQHSRVAKEMHAGEQVGDVVFAFPLTEDTAAALGITAKRTGLLLGMRPSPDVLAKFRDGTLTGFSIGGSRMVDRVVE